MTFSMFAVIYAELNSLTAELKCMKWESHIIYMSQPEMYQQF